MVTSLSLEYDPLHHSGPARHIFFHVGSLTPSHKWEMLDAFCLPASDALRFPLPSLREVFHLVPCAYNIQELCLKIQW